MINKERLAILPKEDLVELLYALLTDVNSIAVDAMVQAVIQNEELNIKIKEGNNDK